MSDMIIFCSLDIHFGIRAALAAGAVLSTSVGGLYSEHRYHTYNSCLQLTQVNSTQYVYCMYAVPYYCLSYLLYKI